MSGIYGKIIMELFHINVPCSETAACTKVKSNYYSQTEIVISSHTETIVK